MESISVSPIGCMKTCFKTKNGTPRQPTVSANTRGQLSIDKSVFNNPEHSLEGLSEYSYVWVLFAFHLNHSKGVKAKVRPPRLDGAKLGVFSTRSPHRPNPIGLTLAKLESVEGPTITVSGLDIVDGTPILDIKPYIPQYDFPQTGNLSKNCKVMEIRTDVGSSEENRDENIDSDILSSSKQVCAERNNDSLLKTSLWLDNPLPELKVVFTSRAENDLLLFHNSVSDPVDHKLEFLSDCRAVRQSIIDILKEDPRSTYRRRKCSDRLYYFTIDICHVTAWFDYSTTPTTVEVVRVKPENMILICHCPETS